MSVWDRIRGRGEARGETPARTVEPSGELSETELHRRVNTAKLLATLPGNAAFTTLRDLVLAEVEKKRDELVDMTPEELTGFKGIETQHFIRGMVSAMAQVAIHCKVGLEAEQKLQALAERAKKPLTQITQIR